MARAIDLEQDLATAISVEAIVPVPARAMDFSEVIALVLMVVLGVRLWFKLASNVVHIAAALVWSPIALQHLSPLAWEHIILTGEYRWASDETRQPGQRRELRPAH